MLGITERCTWWQWSCISHATCCLVAAGTSPSKGNRVAFCNGEPICAKDESFIMISPRRVRSLPTREFSSAASLPSPNCESFSMTSQLHRAKSDVGRVLHLTESNVASRPSHPRVFFARGDSFALRRILHHDLTAPRSMSRRVLATHECSSP